MLILENKIERFLKFEEPQLIIYEEIIINLYLKIV